jgi:hypothetical protein
METKDKNLKHATQKSLPYVYVVVDNIGKKIMFNSTK